MSSLSPLVLLTLSLRLTLVPGIDAYMQRDKKKIPRQIFWRESILVVHFIFIFHDVARWTRQ